MGIVYKYNKTQKHMPRKYIQGKGIVNLIKKKHVHGKGVIDNLIPFAIKFATNIESAKNVGHVAKNIADLAKSTHSIISDIKEMRKKHEIKPKILDIMEDIKQGSGFKYI